MNLTNEQKEKMWEELYESARLERGEKSSSEKTIEEFAKDNKVPIDFARRFLRKKEKEGKLSSRWITLDKARKKVYSPIEN